MGGNSIRVEVVYALPAWVDSVKLELPAGITVREALERSGIAKRHPEITLESQSVGIHGRVVSMDTMPQDADRIEIYRSLAVDPKTARRQRAARNRRR
jgi:uncharacterized protein